MNGMEGLYKFDQEYIFLSNNYNKMTEMELKMAYKLNMSCQHLEFCQTKSDSIYPLAILILQE